MRLTLEYIAGFLDCDGSISIVHSKRPKLKRDEIYPKVNFYSQNLEVLQDIQETIGGALTPQCKTLDVYVLQLPPKVAVETLRVLAPYLRIKKQQALLVLEMNEINHSYKRINRVVPDSIFNKRIECRDKMRELNHKDGKAFRTNRENSVKLSLGETIPSQAVVGVDITEGVTTRLVSPNNNPIQEPPTRKGRDSLSSESSQVIQ
jgi:hypothetical protein